MNYKKKILIMLLISVITGIFSFGTCLSLSTRHYCSPGEFEAIFNFLALFSIAFGTISIVLLFTKGAFDSWKLFAIIYLIVSIFLVSVTSNMGGMLGIDKEFVTMWLAGIFFVVSLGIILGKREKQSSL
ncbi:MAG: hypothetical protein OEV93_00990 [Candidatus Moranbacteria bacterium]|nr:hypothetical protein [Candidatus Moranbacteria bacterium]